MEFGCRSFSFGITDTDNAGLRRYKNAMATGEYLVPYYRYDFTGQQFIEARDSAMRYRRRELCKKLPVFLLRAIGTLFYGQHG